MPETIYTIPINEAFDACIRDKDTAPACPFCALYKMQDERELEQILGASMMEPDTRQKTNAQGFCASHYDKMLKRKNRLGLALILESHLDTLHDDMEGTVLSRLLGQKETSAAKRLAVLQNDCYVCRRLDDALQKITENALYLYETDRAFRQKLSEIPFVCLPHYAMLLSRAKAQLSKKDSTAFASDLHTVNEAYFSSLREDIRLFIRKFDYRFDDLPWGNAKDSPDRAARFLTGDC